MTQASLENNKKNNVDLVLNPIKDDSLITEASISALIEISDFTDLYVDNSNIKNAIAELNSVLKPLQANKTGREIRYQVLLRKDATIAISIDKDEMSASAEITTALGGKHLSAKAILNAAQKANVVKGFSKELLIKLAQSAAKELPGSTVKGVIAVGKEAINGKDARIKHLVESAQERILKPKELDDGNVDMRDLGDIICVKIGDPLAKRIPLTDGIRGFTVTGNPLDPVPGEDVTLNPGSGTTISPKNENVLVSTLVGLPRIIDNGMEVDEIYQIKNVDVSTGHIKFEGSVIIDGDVSEGMKVFATGDISIGGFVESAQLEAGGDITIGSGIIGRKHDVEEEHNIQDMQMSANITAKGNIFAKYCQYGEISCQDLRIENQLMHSIINVKNGLWVGVEDKANGKLIGGYVHAGSSVHAGIVGATAGSRTTINFTNKIELFDGRIEEVEALVTTESDKTEEMSGVIKKLKALPKEKANPDMLTKVVSTYKHHAKRMGEYLNEKERLEHERQIYMSSVYVEATEKLYQGVEVIVGEFTDRSRREYAPTKILYKERKIHLNPIVHSS